MEKTRENGGVFMALGLPFLILGMTSNSAFLAIGIVFFVIGVAMVQGKKL